MKKLITTIGVIFFTLILISSCENSSKESKEQALKEDSTKANADSSKTKEKIETESEKIEPAKISCNIFFKGFDLPDEETGENIKGTVSERAEFNKSTSYTFCYDSESFHHLTISGSGKNLSITVNEESKMIYKKDKIDLKGSLNLTSKDFNFGMGSKYSILIKQEDKVIFNGKIASQGCM